MTDTSPADQLRHAAMLLRNPIRRPELAAVADLPFTEALAKLLEATADQLDVTTHPGWQHVVAAHPLAVARKILGEDTTS